MVNVARQNPTLWYVVVVKNLFERHQRNRAEDITIGLAGLLFMSASACVCGAAQANGYTPILHPTIFWHDNQWETYENGQWVPYRGSANNETAAETEPEPLVMEPPPGSDVMDTNVYGPSYGWGFIGAPAFYPRHHHSGRAHLRPEHRRPVNGIGQPNVGLGRTTIGIDKPNVGIGQTTIAIGRPNGGIGQTTIGIGQPNTGIGRPNAGMGRTTIGIGQPNVGIGQPNVGIGQPNASVGQPNAGMGRPTIGIGQPMSGQHFDQSRGR